MSKAGIKQAFTSGQYTPQFLYKQDIKKLSTDYTRLRDILQKRYKRLKAKGYKTSFTTAVERWGELPRLSQLKKLSGGDTELYKKDVAYWLSEFKSFETEETTAAYQTNLRKQAASSLSESGYAVTSQQIDDYVDFMNYIRRVGIDKKLYAETYEPTETGYRSKRRERTAQEKTFIMKAFEAWLKEKALPADFEVKA